MLTTTFMQHIEKQLDRISYSGMTHAQKEGAMRLLQAEIRDFDQTFQQELHQEMRDVRTSAFRIIKKTFADIGQYVNPKGPIPKMLQEKEQMLRNLLDNDDDIPF